MIEFEAEPDRVRLTAAFVPTVALSAEKQQELLAFLRARDLLA